MLFSKCMTHRDILRPWLTVTYQNMQRQRQKPKMMSSKQRLNHFSFDFQVERSVARLNLKCQMFHFDLMEEKKQTTYSQAFYPLYFKNRHRPALSPSCSITRRRFSPKGQWYLIIKLPPIRALGEVIYFAYVEEGAKLHEPFPHTPAEISSRADLAPQRERGILRAKWDVGPGDQAHWSRPCQSRGSGRNDSPLSSFPSLSLLSLQSGPGSCILKIHSSQKKKQNKTAYSKWSVMEGHESPEGCKWWLMPSPFSAYDLMQVKSEAWY